MIHFDDLVREISSKLPEGAVERHDNTIVVEVDGLGIVMSEMKADDSLMIFTSLCSLPETDAERLEACLTLLKANVFFARTGGYTLSVGSSDDVMLQGLASYCDLAEEGAGAVLLERFVSVADYWRKQLDQQPLSPSSEDMESLMQMHDGSIRI